jgi:putative endonuclease
MASHRQGECPERAKRVEGRASFRALLVLVLCSLLNRRGGRCHRQYSVWFVYILRCVDNSLYIGETSDLESRLNKHLEGIGSSFTARRRPVVLAYCEAHPDRDAALKRERQLKGWTRAKKEALIAGDLARLKAL